MKTRIISGIVMGVIVAAILAAGFLFNSIIISIAIAFMAAGAAYEHIHNAVGIKSKAALIGVCVYSALTAFTEKFTYHYLFILSVLYFVFAVCVVLKNNKEFTLAHIASLCSLPLALSFAFVCLNGVINHVNGIYNLLLLLNFSSVCDMGAYFSGVTCGKPQLCPNVSPKKTVEGAVGGIVSSVIVTLILCLCFNKPLVMPIIFTIPLCILGMLGDLFASSIKRAVGIKDYGNLIPGHGGILDRVDSIIMIAPAFFLLIVHGVM